MTKTIKIGGGEVKLAANAATPLRYKQLFNKDLFKIFAAASKNEEDGIALADTVSELAFIMAKQGEEADMNTLTFDEYVEWLEGYAPMDLVLVSEEVMNFYLQSTNGSVIPKKK